MTPTAAPPPPHRPGQRIISTLQALIRARVTTGLFTILPIIVTVWVLRLTFGLMRDASQWVVYGILHAEWAAMLPPAWRWEAMPDDFLQSPKTQWVIAIASVLLTIFTLYIIGLFAANLIGRRVIDMIEAFIERVPLVKTIYRALKQIFSSFSGDQSKNFQRVALIPFPDTRMRAVGFVTGTFRDVVTGDELVTVFIPTTPNPTSGFLEIMPRGEVTEVPWTVEEAFRAIISGGILTPTNLSIVPNKSLPPGVWSRSSAAGSDA